MPTSLCPECSSLPSAPHAPRCYRGRVEAAELRALDRQWQQQLDAEAGVDCDAPALVCCECGDTCAMFDETLARAAGWEGFSRDINLRDGATHSVVSLGRCPLCRLESHCDGLDALAEVQS